MPNNDAHLKQQGQVLYSADINWIVNQLNRLGSQISTLQNTINNLGNTYVTKSLLTNFNSDITDSNYNNTSASNDSVFKSGIFSRLIDLGRRNRNKLTTNNQTKPGDTPYADYENIHTNVNKITGIETVLKTGGGMSNYAKLKQIADNASQSSGTYTSLNNLLMYGWDKDQYEDYQKHAAWAEKVPDLQGAIRKIPDAQLFEYVWDFEHNSNYPSQIFNKDNSSQAIPFNLFAITYNKDWSSHYNISGIDSNNIYYNLNKNTKIYTMFRVLKCQWAYIPRIKWEAVEDQEYPERTWNMTQWLTWNAVPVLSQTFLRNKEGTEYFTIVLDRTGIKRELASNPDKADPDFGRYVLRFTLGKIGISNGGVAAQTLNEQTDDEREIPDIKNVIDAKTQEVQELQDMRTSILEILQQNQNK